MKKKEFLTEAKRKAIIADKEKAIIESFSKTFNKIKRIDENDVPITGIDKNEIGGKKTLQDIYNETGKVQTKGFCVLIDGPFLQKNPDWKNMPLQLMEYYDTMEKTVAIKNLFKNESSSAYLSEVAPISVSEFSQLAKKAKAKLENMTESSSTVQDKLAEYDGIEGVNGQSVIPNEIFQMEEFERNDYDLVELNIGQDDSKLEIDFSYIETEQGCYYLKATVEFYINISGSYRAATYYEPEEGPEEEFGDGDVVEMKYVDCQGEQEYQLTDEMKQIATPQVLKAFDDLREYISEKAWEGLEDGRDDGPDGDDYDDRDYGREFGGEDW